MSSLSVYVLAAVAAFLLYALQQALKPFVTLYLNLRKARTIGLPIKVLPVPQGLFSFFAFQLLRRLPLPKLHALLNMGRPDGYGMHKEMGDVFVTVNPMGINLVLADPSVIQYVNGDRAKFPKPPNTGAIINIYGRNVINTDGDVWRFHRRVTGPAFSERIHRAVWTEAAVQARMMMDSWRTPRDASSLTPPPTPTHSAGFPEKENILVPAMGDEALRLAMNVITGSAYGTRLGWSKDSNPPCTVKTGLSYRQSLEEVTAHLMSIFLTPQWVLRFSPAHTASGKAWTAYTAFRGYMQGMLDRERAAIQAGDDPEGNLLSALVHAEETEQKEGRKMKSSEVMGNAFIFLFAGHETTANTTHYALLTLAMHQDIQEILLQEIDEMYRQAKEEGREELEYEVDFPRARWAVAIMYETLRIYTPTGITNKWTAVPQPITYNGQTHVIPAHTRVMVNGTGVHFNPKVWGDDAEEWVPARWIVDGMGASDGCDSPQPGMTPQPSRPSSPGAPRSAAGLLLASPASKEHNYLTPPPSPRSAAHMCGTEPSLKLRPAMTRSATSFASQSGTATPQGVLKPPKGTWLPFSEGSRACSGKKFATVEFVAVMCALLREHRVEMLGAEAGWPEARVRKILAGRKAGALTLQTPQPIPLRFVRR